MTSLKSFASISVLSLFMICQSTAHAEALVFLSETKASIRDTSELDKEIENAQYTFEPGFTPISGDVDPDDGAVYALTRNAMTNKCLVVLMDFPNATEPGNVVPLKPAGPEFSCTNQTTDLEFIQTRAGFSDSGWVVTDQSSFHSYDSVTQAYDTFHVIRDDTTEDASVVGIALRGVEGVQSKVLNREDNGTLQLHEITRRDDANGVIQIGNSHFVTGLKADTITSPISFEFNLNSGNLYLLSNAVLYSLNPNTGSAQGLGTIPDRPFAALSYTKYGRGEYSDSITRASGTGPGETITLSTPKGKITDFKLGAGDTANIDRAQIYGVVSFKLTGLNPGESVQVRINTSGIQNPANAYYKCSGPGPDFDNKTCTPFAGAAYDGNTLVITLQDGGAGDSDLTMDGTITDPALIGFVSTSVGENGDGNFLGLGAIDSVFVVILFVLSFFQLLARRLKGAFQHRVNS